MSSLKKPADFPRLETQRCNLNSITNHDLREILLLLRDDNVIENIEASCLYNSGIKSVKAFVGIFDKAFANNRAILWGIKLQESPKQLIGVIATYDIQQNANANVFYALNKQYRKRGIMTECLTEVSEFCIDNFNLQHIALTIKKDNFKSILLARKCGYNEVKSCNGEIVLPIKLDMHIAVQYKCGSSHRSRCYFCFTIKTQ